MPIIRREKRTKGYTVIDNGIFENKTLSLKAKGLLCYLLSRPDDWQVYTEHLKTIGPDGKESIYSGLKELIVAGYIIKETIRGNSGEFKAVGYVINEYPVNTYMVTQTFEHADLPDAGKPDTGKPDPENPPLLSTEYKQVLNEINNVSFTEEIETLYKLYPSKCPIANRSTGKSAKDKQIIKRLLSTVEYSVLRETIELYLKSCLDSRCYVKNFKTFLNNLPDLDSLRSTEVKKPAPASPSISEIEFQEKRRQEFLDSLKGNL